MRVAVIGAGGIGGLYGGLLARAGHEVRFLARGPHLQAIKQRGLEVRSADFGTFSLPVHASNDPADLGADNELVLFTVKTYDLDAALPAAAQALSRDGSVLTFQNGLDAPDQVAASVGSEHVLVGTTALETTVLEPGVIGHLTPGHVVTIAAFSGAPTAQVDAVFEAFKAAGINTVVADDARRALWEKASLLIPMATLTTVCQSAIGPIRELPETREFAHALVRETAAVASACGYDMPEIGQRAMAGLDRVPYTMKASMARDFERGGRTELEALTGALVRLADARSVDIPATQSAYAVLKLRAQQTAAGRVSE